MLFEALKTKSYLKAATNTNTNNNTSKSIEVKKLIPILTAPSVDPPPIAPIAPKPAQNNQAYSSHKTVLKEDPVKVIITAAVLSAPPQITQTNILCLY